MPAVANKAKTIKILMTLGGKIGSEKQSIRSGGFIVFLKTIETSDQSYSSILLS